MNRGQALTQARKILEDSCIEDSSLEGEILLRHVLGIARAELFSGLDEEITPSQAENLMNLLERRRNGEPSAYITGHREFYGLGFKVDPRALIPRPETELLVEKAIQICRKRGFSSVADIGTGCGCIAVSLAKNLPGITVYAVDASLPALELAEDNSIAHHVKDRITFLWGDLLKPLSRLVDMVVANLPYVRTEDVTHGCEPETALNGGKDGMDKIRQLVPQLRGSLVPHGVLLLEIGQGQADAVMAILHNSFTGVAVEVEKDLAGIERIVAMSLTS